MDSRNDDSIIWQGKYGRKTVNHYSMEDEEVMKKLAVLYEFIALTKKRRKEEKW